MRRSVRTSWPINSSGVVLTLELEDVIYVDQLWNIYLEADKREPLNWKKMNSSLTQRLLDKEVSMHKLFAFEYLL